jgi:acetyl esterase/lipase
LRPDRRALLAEATAFYRRPELLSGGAFFPQPPEMYPLVARRGALANGGQIVDLKWESQFEPHWEVARKAYLSVESNHFAYVRLFRQPTPAPTVVYIHGYRGGQFFVEERFFPTRWLYSLGLNVALFTLPFHGRRGGTSAPAWPSANIARANEGFAQAIFDLRALFNWLARTQGEQPIALAGMSLGGYTTALASTVDLAPLAPLAMAVPMIPVASFPDLFWEHGEGRSERARAEREGITLDMLRQAMELHTPIARTPVVPSERMLILSAAGDRIAPPEHATRLARHFGAEEVRFPGGHVLQFGRGTAFRAVARRAAKLGLLAPRR